MTYDDSTLWTYHGVKHGHTRSTPLRLRPEINGTAMSDDYTPDEITAETLFHRWKDRYVDAAGHAGYASIYWTVEEVGETAPFQEGWGDGDFLTYWTWPTDPDGNRLNWNRLPVADGAWRDGNFTKGGFFQEHTGWKPAPLQARVHVPTILLQAGLL